MARLHGLGGYPLANNNGACFVDGSVTYRLEDAPKCELRRRTRFVS
jgi:hypothetical protein